MREDENRDSDQNEHNPDQREDDDDIAGSEERLPVFQSLLVEIVV